MATVKKTPKAKQKAPFDNMAVKVAKPKKKAVREAKAVEEVVKLTARQRRKIGVPNR